MNLGPVVNSAYHDSAAGLSPDGLLLTFADFPGSVRPGGYGGADLWMARRASVSSPWQTPVNMGPIVNGQGHEWYPVISPDGSTLYFYSDSNRGAIQYLCQASIIRIVDFNGDGKMDGKDVLCMVAQWGTDDSLCDIGPFAWGDGTVGLEDLTVLAGYLGKEVSDPTLVAHWALDEAEGMVAHDSIGNNDAFVIGVPVWQPTGGQVNGALQLDGIDDCAVTNPVLSPAEGPFSVFVWVKGGAPGQVVLSQIGGANWLCVDSLEGKLMTELKGPGQSAGPLLSQTVITDGNWHRIGFVWDGLYRTLYVDDIAVAEDTHDSLEGSSNGLYIGTGKAMGSGTYWSGLIDDVRIYNRAVKP